MQTRRDQLHAYRFMTRRAMSALVTGEPDTVEPPMRRLTVTTISGLMVAIVVAAVFAVVGLLRPGAGDDWKKDGSIVGERETGARYVVIQGTLHPVLNYPSAVLASDATGPVEVQFVPREKLNDLERGDTIGIPQLPDSMPSADELVTGPVTVCSQIVPHDLDDVAEVTVDVGTDPSASALGQDAVYVESVDQKAFLLWDGKRHEIASAALATALGITQRPVTVGRAFLDAVPLGTPFEAPTLDGVGRAPAVPDSRGLRVGQLVHAADDPTSYVMLSDGVVAVTEVQARLLQTLDVPRPRTLDLGAISAIQPSDAQADDLATQTGDLPATVPDLSTAAPGAGGACVRYAGDDGPPDLTVPSGAARTSTTSSEGRRSQQGLADHVHVRPGAGLLARATEGAGVSLVIEPGLRFTAANLGVLVGFGFADENPVDLPAGVLDVIPPGGALDPAAARTVAGSGSAPVAAP